MELPTEILNLDATIKAENDDKDSTGKEPEKLLEMKYGNAGLIGLDIVIMEEKFMNFCTLKKLANNICKKNTATKIMYQKPS